MTRLRRFAGLLAHPRAAFLVSALIGFGARATETGSKFLLQLTVARTLGPSGTGNVFLALSIANVLCTLGRIGLDRALTFRIATTLALADAPGQAAARAHLRRLLGSGMALCLSVSGGLAAVTAVFAGPLAALLFHDPGFANPLRIMAAGIVPLAVLAMMVGIMNGVERSSTAQLVGAALWPAMAAALSLLARNVADAVLALLASMLVACAVALYLMWRSGLLPALSLQRDAIRSLSEIGWPLFAVDTVQIMLISLPTIVLGAYRPADVVGVFSLANRISLILTVVLIVMSGVGSSRMAGAHARGDQDALQRVMRNLFALSFLASIPAVAVLFAFAPEVLGLFGAGFRAGAPVLRVLLLGQTVGILFTCAPNLLEMTGNGWRLRRVNLVALAVNAGGCFALIPQMGAMGAALATTFTLISYNIVCGVMAWHHVGIHASPLAIGGRPRQRGLV